ncbi:hypothetical protein BDFB_008632 [Asbolus verrucosus]|uniref:Uncharacterized protein n=1 Tax=Asbolus verrucosus TaxID=1661398 RepID=A0A482VA11_ASBVE|nr:hypothetical protein BDFB_008632 [Asbolus verrucosus]
MKRKAFEILLVAVRTLKQQQNGRLPLHHAVKDKQEYRERGSTVHIITADRDEIANRMGRSWAPGATRARTAPYIIDWRLEGPPEPPRQHCLRTILYDGIELSIGSYKFITTNFTGGCCKTTPSSDGKIKSEGRPH